MRKLIRDIWAEWRYGFSGASRLAQPDPLPTVRSGRQLNKVDSSTHSTGSFNCRRVVILSVLTWQLVTRVVHWLVRWIAMPVATSPLLVYCSMDYSARLFIHSLFAFCCWNVAHGQPVLFWGWQNLPNLPSFSNTNIQLVNNFVSESNERARSARG